MSLDLNDYNFNLPKKLIANKPVSPRDSSKLLTFSHVDKEVNHHKFSDLIKILTSNDVLVLNQSKVFPARLFGHKKTGARIEILLLRQLKSNTWLAISKPRPKIKDKIIFPQDLVGQITKSNSKNGQIEIKFNFKNQDFFKLLEKIAFTPLPPYISSTQTEAKIKKEYQTVYAKKIGSAAAPTAGLHFTKELLSSLKKKGIQIEYITLHVGLGTFQNLRPENIKTKTLHSEFYEITKETAKRLNLAKKEGKRIISVGTTSLRTLESAINNKSQIVAGKKSTNLFIFPPYKFKFVDALITNFHLPKSSLLILVSAFVGRQNILRIYQQAIKKKYRFFSFGDATFLY